ncbi:Cytochrome P450 714C2 [Camellia lanceoleosa]|nr:Cytochrome P450 714C2 [Camellia lanceoleosa]
MMNLVSECSMTLVNSWKRRIESEGGVADINIDGDMRSFSGDVISRPCFGNNYAQGEKIFLKLRALQETESKKAFVTGIPGMR